VIAAKPNVELLRNGFNWERFLGKTTEQLQIDQIVNNIVMHTDDVLSDLCEENAKDLFFQLRDHFRARNDWKRLEQSTKHLQTRLSVVSISTLALSVQQSILRFAFRNEGRVWMLRGGRPGEETVGKL
jgi:hypothetical protein